MVWLTWGSGEKPPPVRKTKTSICFLAGTSMNLNLVTSLNSRVGGVDPNPTSVNDVCTGGVGRILPLLARLVKLFQYRKWRFLRKKSWGKTMLPLIFFRLFYAEKLSMTGDFCWFRNLGTIVWGRGDKPPPVTSSSPSLAHSLDEVRGREWQHFFSKSLKTCMRTLPENDRWKPDLRVTHQFQIH